MKPLGDGALSADVDRSVVVRDGDDGIDHGQALLRRWVRLSLLLLLRALLLRRLGLVLGVFAAPLRSWLFRWQDLFSLVGRDVLRYTVGRTGTSGA